MPPRRGLPSGRETKLKRQGREAVRLLAGFGRAEAEVHGFKIRPRQADIGQEPIIAAIQQKAGRAAGLAGEIPAADFPPAVAATAAAATLVVTAMMMAASC